MMACHILGIATLYAVPPSIPYLLMTNGTGILLGAVGAVKLTDLPLPNQMSRMRMRKGPTRYNALTFTRKM